MPLNQQIADLILEQGRARAAGDLGSGQAWGNALSQIGQNVGNLIMSAPQMAAADRRAQLEKLQLTDAQQKHAAFDVLGQAMQTVAPQGPTEPGQPPMAASHPYLDANGLADPTKITQLLSANGLGHIAPEVLKGIESQNASIREYKQYREQAATKQAIMLGSVANTTLALMKGGMPFDQAATHAGSSLIATGLVQPQELEQTVGKIAGLPPDQQIAQLEQLKATAARLGPTKTLADGAKEVDMFGGTVAENPKEPTKPTRASLAAIAADPTKSPQERDQAREALKSLETKPTPESVQQKEVLLDGKPAVLLLHPKAGDKDEFYTDASNKVIENAASRIRPIPPASAAGKSQQELEQEYRTVLIREISSRSGGLGLEDSKVLQANHLLAIFDQSYDPKTGEYNIPAVLQEELALGLARLTSPSGQVGVELAEKLNQPTAYGKMKSILTYWSGKPLTGNTQDVFKMFRDSIQRQGEVAMGNREAGIKYLRGLAPTDLEEKRRKALEANTLAPLRQSRIIQNKATGERKIQISTDGGETWK